MQTTTLPAVSANDRLGLTLFIAAMLHGVIILGVSFNPEDLAELKAPPALEILLVQKRNNTTPKQADYLAQIAQSGGGESTEKFKPSNPFTSSEQVEATGVAPIPLQAGSPQAKPLEQDPLITQPYAEEQVEQRVSSQTETPDKPAQEVSEFDLEIARLTTELDLAIETYAKRPKKLVLTAGTHEYIPARYMHEWVQKVERLGNLNLPDEARQRGLEGALLLEVEIKWDGSIIETNVIQSSGHVLLDNAALRIVELASPFPPFPVELRNLADHLEIVRTWHFQKGGLKTR